jgi:Reverse transcriptase (RNA-dependent DNA polymerase)
MRKRIVAKGNVHRSDHLRALVTDTLPGDVPIIISNDGFYRNMHPGRLTNSVQNEFVERLLTPRRSYTEPYRYNILRPGGTPRRLSLMHPSGQLGVVDLYRNYSDLICYYCRKSEASIRSPYKVGSLFFVRGSASDQNLLKRSGVDTVDLETTVSNPASYFAYGGFDRVFKFFDSAEYRRLEKRYSVSYSTDIAKCFHSIYTHTLFWAIADVKTAKDSTNASSFGNSFDRLMQSVNYNETNGICVGAEVSRIFAELILSEVDRQIIKSLDDQGKLFRVHYEFRRYVDDFFIFAKDDETARRVLEAIELCLSKFNLHLNEMKTSRPFITKKSKMIRDANKTLEEFFDKFIELYKFDQISYSYPLRIRRPQTLLRMIIDGIKASCFENQGGYEETSKYVISALGNRITGLVNGYQKIPEDKGVSTDDYVSAILLLLEAIYFFYNVDPTVTSSLKVAQAAIMSFKFFSDHIPDRAPFLSEQVVRWTFQFMQELNINPAHPDHVVVPLEAINILIVLGEVGGGESLARQAIAKFCCEVDPIGYFQIVSYLFCLGDHGGFDSLREQLFTKALGLLRGKDRLRIEAQAAHLSLDLLSCPYISSAKRAKLFNDLRADMDLQRVSIPEAVAAVAAFEESPWFVNWRGAQLLAMIRKKELSAVY